MEGYKLYGSTEKQAVVIEIGSATTKCGFAGESTPRAIFPTSLRLNNGKQLCFSPAVAEIATQNDWNEAIETFLNHIYFVHLQCTPKERKVIIVENLLSEKLFRNAVAYVLFEKLYVPSVIFSPNIPLALLPLKTPTGLLIDSGYTETRILPAYEGNGLLFAFRAGYGLGMETVKNELKKLLLSQSSVINPFLPPSSEDSTPVTSKQLTNDVIEDIIFQYAFVSPDPTIQSPDTVVRYTLDYDKVLKIPTSARFKCTESIFNGNDEDESIATLILNSLLRCKPDTRAELARSMVLIGGTVKLRGFKSRLLYELKRLVQTSQYSALKGLSNEFDFLNSKYESIYLGWLGGSVLGSLETEQQQQQQQQPILRTSYMEKKKFSLLPDWSKLTLSEAQSTPSAPSLLTSDTLKLF